jgi:hypothetical protein
MSNRNGRKRGEQPFFLNCGTNNRDRMHVIRERRLLADTSYSQRLEVMDRY